MFSVSSKPTGVLNLAQRSLSRWCGKLKMVRAVIAPRFLSLSHLPPSWFARIKVRVMGPFPSILFLFREEQWGCLIHELW